MAVRQMYSCDWCSVDAPRSGSMGDGWQVRHHPSTGKDVHLCFTCFQAWCRAWELARKARYEETHPPDDDRPDDA